MSAELIDLSYILEREKEVPLSNIISLDSFFGKTSVSQAANDNQDIPKLDDLDRGFLIDISIENAIMQVRNSLHKKLDSRYFSILFEDDRRYFTEVLQRTLAQESFAFLSEEKILNILEKELQKLGIGNKVRAIILEF